MKNVDPFHLFASRPIELRSLLSSSLISVIIAVIIALRVFTVPAQIISFVRAQGAFSLLHPVTAAAAAVGFVPRLVV